MPCTWDGFIEYLTHQIDWNNTSAFADNSLKVEGILRELSQAPHEIEARTKKIAGDKELFSKYLPHMQYPRQPMDKFVLYLDPNDLFRVRIHRHRTVIRNNAMIERRHLHKWHMHTIMLSGRYVEEQYRIDEYDDRGRARLVETKRHELEQGGTNSVATGIVHRISNPSETDSAITLFVRGPSLSDRATIFEDDGTPIETFSLDEHTRNGLLSIGRLETDFH